MTIGKRSHVIVNKTIDSRIGGGIGNAINYGFPSALRYSYSVYYTT